MQYTHIVYCLSACWLTDFVSAVAPQDTGDGCGLNNQYLVEGSVYCISNVYVNQSELS